MNVSNSNMLQACCKRLTKYGETLTITWVGRRNLVTATLDDVQIDLGHEVEAAFMERVQPSVSAIKFNDCFLTEGKVTYDPVTDSFSGTGKFITVFLDVHQCQIPVIVPEDLLFDELQIHYDNSTIGTFDTFATFKVAASLLQQRHRQMEWSLAGFLDGQISGLPFDLVDLITFQYEPYIIKYENFCKKGRLREFIIRAVEYLNDRIEDVGFKIYLGK